MAQVHLVGGGIASLAAAAFLIKDGAVSGKNITIYEEHEKAGGSVESQGSPERGYQLRSGRMLEADFNCTYELLSFIPSLADSTRTVQQEILEFHQDFFWKDSSRLVDGGRPVEMTELGFNTKDRLDITELFAIPEDLIGRKRISDWFRPDFFHTNFWYTWATTFAFQPWHSVVEFKRSLLRYVHLFSSQESPSGMFRTQYNQYDLIVRPLVRWLAERGVNFEMGAEITDVEFKLSDKEKTVRKLRLHQGDRSQDIDIKDEDLVFISNGCMSSNTSLGSMESAPVLDTTPGDNAWKLWESLSKKATGFGHPEVFNKNYHETMWESFTVTASDEKFFEMFQKFTGEEIHKGGFVTLKDSNWLLSVVLDPQPHFYDQPEDVFVWWGYGLYPEQKGNFVQKKMYECSGREILTEVFSHFRFMDEMLEMLNTSNCLPCLMPYVGSPLMPREKGDRPLVIPKGATNVAFIGQFCEVPHEAAFTIEYSVRSAQTAVYELLKLDKKVAPLTKNYQDVGVLFNAFRSMNKVPRKIQPEHRA